jgi:hypothetical protein
MAEKNKNESTVDRSSSSETTKVDGQQMTWDQIVSKYGETEASEIAPNLDPRYQALLSKEGSEKAASDYSKQVLDPETETTGIAPDMEAGIHRLKSSSVPDARGLGDVLGFVDNPVGPTEGAVGLKPDNNTSAAKGKGAATNPTGTTTITTGTAAEDLMNGLVNQYQSIMGDVNPYISGQAGQQAAAQAQSIGEGLAGGGVSTATAPGSAKLNQDYQNIAAANTAGSKGIVTAMQDTGKADDLYLAASPYQGLLSALQSEAQYQLETGGGTINSGTLKNSPAWLQNAYQFVLGNSNANAGTSTVGNANAATAATTPSTNTGTSGASGTAN